MTIREKGRQAVSVESHLSWLWPENRAAMPCMRDERTSLTYGETVIRVDAVAGQLERIGVGAGDVVAISMSNRVELPVVMQAAWRLGAAATPMNPAFTAREAEFQLKDSSATVLVTDAVDTAPWSVPVPVLGIDELLTSGTGPTTAAAVDAHDLALIIYTSGSTGKPKGVMLEHEHLDVMTTMLIEQFAFTDADRCLLFLPLFHVNALCVSLLSMMRVGGQLGVMKRFSLEELVARLGQWRPTYFAAVPTIFARLAELPENVHVDTASIRFANCGAAPASQPLLDRIRERFGFVLTEGYGLTEGTCASACNPLNGVRKVGTVGPALPGQEIAIVAPDGSRCAPGVSGEIVVRGPNVMRGYLNRPEETAATIVDGWLHTGDVGTLDEDGYLTLVDRIKDMIIRGGENIYPKEIESVLLDHPHILEAAVVGLPHDLYGEVPIAYVVALRDADVDPDAVLAFCAESLTRVKVPVEIVVIDALPKNPIGKIDKPGLRITAAAR